MNAATLFEPGDLPAPPSRYAVPRFRLSLVREPDSPFAGGDHAGTDPAAIVSFLALAGAYNEPAEAFGAVLLDTRNRLIGWSVLYRGCLSRAQVEPRAVLQVALLANAAGVVVYHNHPSGDPSPSVEDVAFTRKLEWACDACGVRLVDHLVLGNPGAFVSIRQRGGLS